MVKTDRKVEAISRLFADTPATAESERELAESCERLIRSETQVSAVSSTAMAREFVKRAKPHRGFLYQMALRTLGWSLLVSGKHPESKEAYLQARRLAKKDAMIRARIDRILIDVYMYLGQTGEARRRARLALDAFAKLGAADETAKARVSLANVLHRQDRHLEASRLYSQAANHFVRRKNLLAAALCWYNLANTRVQLFDFVEANRLYSEARKIFSVHGHELHATGCLYGLAWLHMLQGKFHIALRELGECESFYARGHQPREMILCQLDRSEIYLGLNLFLDARQAAQQAGREAKKLGIGYETAKADLFRGRALAALGHLAGARTSLKRAETGFEKAGNKGFAAAASLALAQVGPKSQQKLQNIRALRKSFARAQLPLWEAVCDLQIISDWPEETAALKRLAINRAVRAVPHMAAQHRTVLGDRQAAAGRMKAAVSHWSKAADILDAVRAKLPPVEMRTSFFAARSEPHRRLIQAEFKDRPLQAAVWSERFKTVGIWSTSSDFFMANPTRSRIQENLSELAAYVTSVSRAISNPDRKRTAGVRTPEKLAAFHREIRQNLARLEHGSSHSHRQTDIAALIKETSRRQPIVQFHVGHEDILAFIHQGGTSKAWRYAGGRKILNDMVARWRFIVECAPRPQKKASSAHLKDERAVLARIANWLLPPLELSSKLKKLLIIPEGQLSGFPWVALPVNGCLMGEQLELIHAPSLRHYWHAKREGTKSAKVRIFVGSTAGLTHLKREISAISSRLGVESTSVCSPCRRSDWPDHSQARIWHYAGHAHLRGDNPFYSSLLLEDGPLFAADFRLKRNKINLVTLAACRTGQQTCLPGEEATGLVRSLLEMGARSIVASGWAVSDRSTSMWMDIFYKNYLNGLTAAQAVRAASLEVREHFPLACHWGSFAVHGAG